MDIITGPGGEAQRAEIVVPMSLKTCNMKHGARRRLTRSRINESTNDDGVAFGIQGLLWHTQV